MNLRFVRRNDCPCCGSTDLIKKAIVHGRLDSTSPEEDLRKGWVGINARTFFTYYCCAQCKSLRVSEYPDEETISRLYSNMPANMHNIVSTRDQYKNQQGYARIITPFINRCFKPLSGLSVLEFGSDCGLLAAGIGELNDTTAWHYTAIEPNGSVRNKLESILRRNYSSHEIKGDASALFNGTPPRRYDIVVAIHVFDHIFAIEELLKSIRKILTKNGFIFFVVHNPRSIVARTLGRQWPPYCAQHPQLFSIAGVKAISERTGLKMVQTGRTYNYFSLRMILEYFGFCLSPLDNIRIKAPLGNRFYILANNEDEGDD